MLTAPYTPEQNGANEREMRTPIEMTRTLKNSNPEKRRKMDKKAIQGYLVGYDGDERYRIRLKKEHRVILYRDVIFQENAGKFADRTELKLGGKKDRLRKETHQGKYEEQLIKIEDNPIESRQLRNRSLLQKPKLFEDHIMEAESFLDDYNPEIYEEAGTLGYGITYHATETKDVLHRYSDLDVSACTKQIDQPRDML
ncbi:retrovirus-related Pol polyprotein from transposon TNT 1-94 [Trichonephila inaurata madagascariensis]|uniref:Retrovirus-related Pol polyprotein from transposon TNT 1-94 n=1 Tax=Trichonephila inaurata madagascariensis TaxID=2747483 RepID=A0A8X6X906_9ARAC|nr:retrovirus-related Pol polyprotein from transposon TNT 1-94 [Trichonephila inaurata madagascariensis]